MTTNGAAGPGTPGDGYQDTNERDIESKQDDAVSDSEAFDDPDVDSEDVKVLPGTGGPDDVGELEGPFEYDPTGHAGEDN